MRGAIDDREVIRSAAIATLRLRGVRVSSESWLDRTPSPSLWAREEGLADLEDRRAQTSHTFGPAPYELVAPIARAFDERHPWLVRDEERSALADLVEHGFPAPTQNVYIGGATYTIFEDPDGGFRRSDGDPTRRRRSKNDPLWILEALACTDVAHPLGEDEADGQTCRRFAFDVDLQRHRRELDAVKGPSWTRAPHVLGEASIDAEHRIRRVTWHEVVPRRRRTRARNHGRDGRDAKRWTTIVLRDFGIPVDIPIPKPEPPHGSIPVALANLAREMWRRKRGYQRQPPTP